MRTAQEYDKEIKTLCKGIDILEHESVKEQMSVKPDLSRVKLIKKNIENLEQKIKYLAGQRRKAERIEARGI